MEFYADLTQEERIQSYDFIENFISTNVPDWSKWNEEITTDDVEALFSSQIALMPNKQFEFLLLHSGYIPDHYGNDSSQETLYSKLIESLVCEWAKRIGFESSHLQKQKSNKEDITIQKGNLIIVCDAKSFRLGRSQAAPNVKDVIKKQAYNTWLMAYEEDVRVGGLTTFPSLHDWQRGGEAYTYFTEGNPSVMMLYYEQMAYLIHKNIDATSIIDFLNSYSKIYPESSSVKSVYWSGIEENLFNDKIYSLYMTEIKTYLKEKVLHTIGKIHNRITHIEEEVNNMLPSLSMEELRELAKHTLITLQSQEMIKQEERINAFRLNRFDSQ